MAENRNIKYNLTFAINSDVRTATKLILEEDHLEWGKWVTAPPSQIATTIGGSKTISFKACGAECSSTGTEGTVRYKATDTGKTIFKIKFDIPYSSANSGNLTGGSDNYDTEGGDVPASGNSKTVDISITQVK